VRAMFSFVDYLICSGQYSQAYEWAKRMAREGDPEGLMWAAFMLISPWIKEDREPAAPATSEMLMPRDMMWTVFMLRHPWTRGGGVPSNLPLGISLLRTAASSGHVYAALTLGVWCKYKVFLGDGAPLVPPYDPQIGNQALHWLSKAVECGTSTWNGYVASDELRELVAHMKVADLRGELDVRRIPWTRGRAARCNIAAMASHESCIRAVRGGSRTPMSAAGMRKQLLSERLLVACGAGPLGLVRRPQRQYAPTASRVLLAGVTTDTRMPRCLQGRPTCECILLGALRPRSLRRPWI